MLVYSAVLSACAPGVAGGGPSSPRRSWSVPRPRSRRRARATADAKALVTSLNRAFALGDVKYLLGHLHPAVTAGRHPQCRSYLTTLVRQPPRLKATAFAAPADYEYASDGLSTTVRKVIFVTATVTIGGRSDDDGARHRDPLVHRLRVTGRRRRRSPPPTRSPATTPGPGTTTPSPRRGPSSSS